jgi:hypothetical protein
MYIGEYADHTHLDARSSVKPLGTDFYWTTAKDDTMKVIKIQRLPVLPEADDEAC